MINSQRNIKYENIYKKESLTHRGNIPKINLNIKSLQLPIINSNVCYSERIRFNTTKKILKNSKEEKKFRNKCELNYKENKEPKIKYLTLKKEDNKDNILFLLRNIKVKNVTEIKQKHINRNIKKNKSKTPKKLKTISINEPNLTYNNNIYLNTNITNNIKEKEENKYIAQTKTKDNNSMIVHNIYFQWKNKNFDLNKSYDLSISSLSSKNLYKTIKINYNNENKKIKSADISRKNNIKIDYLNYKDILFEDGINNISNYSIKMINKENIDKNYINIKMIENLLNTLSRNQKLNKSGNKLNSNVNFKSSLKLVNNNNYDNFKNYLLKNGDNFLSKFLKKLMSINKKNKKEIEQNKIKESNILKNSYNKKEIKNEEIKINGNKQQIENKSLENSDIKKKHYNIILISSPEKISKEKKEIIESYNAIMKNKNKKKYQNQNYFMNYKGDIKINSSLGNLNGNNTFNIGRKNKNFFKDKSFNENEINIMNNNKNDNSSIKINSKIFDKSTEKDIINNNNEKNSILKNIINNGKEIHNYNNKKEDISQIDNDNNNNYNKKINNNIANNISKNTNNEYNIYYNINNNIRDIINKDINIKTNINKDINNYINNNINNDINDIINNKIISHIKNLENEKEENKSNNNLNNEYFVNEKRNDNLLLISNNNNKNNNKNNNNIYNDTKEKLMNNNSYTNNNINNINTNNSPQKDKKEMNNNNNINENNKTRSPSKKGSVLINIKGRKNPVIRQKRRSTYINPSPKKIIKRNKNILPLNNINITELNKPKNKLILSEQVSDNESQESNSSEKDNIIDLPSKGNKIISELDKILFKEKKSKSRQKKIKKKIKKEKKEESQIRNIEDEDEIKLLNPIKEKNKNFQEENEILDLMNYNENDFIIKNESELSTNKSLTKEDMNNLIIYSTKLRELSELKEKNKNKDQIEEITEQIKEIKQKYDLIINKYLMNQKYKNLIKNNNDQKQNFKLSKKFIKFYLKENNSNKEEQLIESEHEINTEDNKPQYSNDVRTEIENSEEEDKNEKENDKKLIYDNSYMFKKEKKEKKIKIKKEVLDILNLKLNFNTEKNNNEINIKNNSSDIKININIRKRNKKKIFRNYRKTYLPRKKQINFNNNINNNFNKLSLFTDINEEKIEKINDEENEKEKLLEHKLKIFFNDIQNLKKNLINIDNLDFIKKENNKRKEYMTRLNEFNKNINNLQIKDKNNKAKLNFLSPIQFKTKNF